MRIWALVVTALIGGSVRADITAPQAAPSVKAGNWCRDFYDAERARLGASKVSWGQEATGDSHSMLHIHSGVELKLRVPADYQMQEGSDAWAKTKVQDSMHELTSGWSPILVLYDVGPGPSTHSFESILPTMRLSGALYPATVTHQIRPTTVGELAARELCAVVARSPGHGTFKKGGHFPLPLTYDLVHGFEFRSDLGAVGIIYRIEQSRIVEDEAKFGVVTARKR